jgi:hypothetical protein
MRHPSMTTRGTRLAFVVAVAIAFFLPKRVECGFPGATCGHAGRWRTICTDYEIEPLGFYVIELAARRDVGFAYSAGDDCR